MNREELRREFAANRYLVGGSPVIEHMLAEYDAFCEASLLGVRLTEGQFDAVLYAISAIDDSMSNNRIPKKSAESTIDVLRSLLATPTEPEPLSDRNAIIEECAKVAEEYGAEDGEEQDYQYGIASDDIAMLLRDLKDEPEQPSSEPRFGKWISVKERLPEQSRKVYDGTVSCSTWLLLHVNDSVHMGYYIEKQWQTQNGEIPAPTHWMPLPLPPTDSRR